MKKILVLFVIISGFIFAISCGRSVPVTPSVDTATSTYTVLINTFTATFTWTQHGTATFSPTITNTYTATLTPENTATLTMTATQSATVTGTETKTLTPSVTETITETSTITETATITETHSVTLTATVTNTRTALPSNVVYREGINSYSGAGDSSIYSATPGINSGTCSYISVLTSASETVRSVIRFDLSALAGRTVASADLRLYVGVGTPADNTNLRMYALTKDFVEGSNCGIAAAGMVSWDSAGSSAWDTAGGDFSSVAMSPICYIGSSSVNPITFQLDPATVQSWIDNGANNYGMMIKAVTETSAGQSVNFGSGEHVNTSLRPQMRVYYY